jgi:hypothetical protein
MLGATLMEFLAPLLLLGGPTTSPQDPPDPGYSPDPLNNVTYFVTGSASPGYDMGLRLPSR